MLFDITFDLHVKSNCRLPVNVVYKEKIHSIKETAKFNFAEKINVQWDDVQCIDLCKITGLQADPSSAITISNLSINEVEIDADEIQDYFSLEMIDNKFVENRRIEKISSICFNGTLKIVLNNFFWCPYYHSSKKLDFVYNNRFLWKYKNTSMVPFNYDDVIQKRYGNRPYDESYNNNKTYDVGAFGCSITYGTGLERNTRWSNVMSNDSVNFGQPRLGIDGIYMNLKSAMKQFKWKKTVILLPNFERKLFAFRLSNGNYCRYPVTVSAEWAPSGLQAHYWKNWSRCIDKKYQQYFTEKYKRVIKDILIGKIDVYWTKVFSKLIKFCDNSNIPYYISSWDSEVYKILQKQVSSSKILPYFTSIDKSFDNVHPGPKSHRNWVNLCKNIME